MKVLNVLKNDKGDVRVTFDLGKGLYAVVKLFDSEKSGNLFTVKFWLGADIKTTQSYWSTKTPVAKDKIKIFTEMAEKQLLIAKKLWADI